MSVGCPDFDYWIPGHYSENRLYEFSGTKWLEPIINEFISLYMISPNEGWSGFVEDDDSAWMFKYDGNTWAKNQQTGWTRYSVPMLMRFAKENPSEGWGLDNFTSLWRYKDGIWSLYDPNRELMNLHGLWVNSDNDVWTVGPYHGVFHWDGSSWTNVYQTATGGLRDISFIDENHGVAVGSYAPVDYSARPVVAVYENGVWTEVPVALPPGYTNMGLSRVRMVSPTEAWAIGYSDYASTEAMIVRLKLPVSQANMSLSRSPLAPMPGSIVANSISESGTVKITNLRTQKGEGNPFATEILFDVSGDCDVKVRILERNYREIISLAIKASGENNKVAWSGKNIKDRVMGPEMCVAEIEAIKDGKVSRRFLWFKPGEGSGARSVVFAPQGAPPSNGEVIDSTSGRMNSKAEYVSGYSGFHDVAVRTSRISRVQASPGIALDPYGLRERAQTKNATPSSPAAASGGHIMEMGASGREYFSGEIIPRADMGFMPGARSREPAILDVKR